MGIRNYIIISIESINYFIVIYSEGHKAGLINSSTFWGQSVVEFWEFSSKCGLWGVSADNIKTLIACEVVQASNAIFKIIIESNLCDAFIRSIDESFVTLIRFEIFVASKTIIPKCYIFFADVTKVPFYSMIKVIGT